MGKTKSPAKAEGKVKKKVKKVQKTSAETKTEPEQKERPKFSTVEVFSKPGAMAPLFEQFTDAEVGTEVVRPRLLTESVEHGRGKGIIRNSTFRKFKEVPKAVFFITFPRASSGGSFEPTDRLMKPGEQMQLSYTADVEGAEKPLYFMGKGFFLRKSFYVAQDPNNSGKPWTGTREEANEKLSKDLVVGGEDIIEVRVDSVTCFPNGPGSTRRDVLERYLSAAKLYVMPGGGGWNQKSTQGNYFDSVKDPLDKYIEREGIKVIDKITLDEFGNLGNIDVLIKETLLADIEHDKIRPMVIKKPNDHLRDINMAVGFLLHFKITDEIKESLMRTFAKKAGPENEVFLPLFLERVSEAKEQYRITFRLFPRDLIEERGRKSMERGLKFMPPYALHQGPENHNTYSKMLIAISQRFREDEKPEDEKLKSEKLQASVQKRMADQQHKFVDEKLKTAFQGRVSAKKRKDEGG